VRGCEIEFVKQNLGVGSSEKRLVTWSLVGMRAGEGLIIKS